MRFRRVLLVITDTSHSQKRQIFQWRRVHMEYVNIYDMRNTYETDLHMKNVHVYDEHFSYEHVKYVNGDVYIWNMYIHVT